MASFDVIVVGAGHAGCEAAWAAAQLGARVGICTLSLDTVALMPCNPAIGGTAKGHLVREIDALGGLMGEAIDATGIQFKVLNRSRGPAVWSPRAQADKRRYGGWMREKLSAHPNITWLIERAGRILVRNGRVCGLAFEDRGEVECRALVITTGTFLRGIVHVGDEQMPAGRSGEPPSVALADSIRDLGVTMGRLKTGTPPRLSRQSIDFSKFQVESGDVPPVPFSFMTAHSSLRDRRQIECHLLHSSDASHDLVRHHISRSPLYNGQIQGVGPRYCPSFEDKVMRFPDRARHQIFLEPEGVDVDEIYVNGLSMSLPRAVQEEIVHALPGLAEARFIRHAYAVEYDFVQPTALTAALEVKQLPGLYFAGQINGTSGYEEAAAQGVVAGINAAGQGDRVVFDRSQSYIGVLVDDLITQGCLEPYRMFTSRAEHRLSLRIDNADLRLTPIGRAAGLVSERRWETFLRRRERLELNRRTAESARVTINGEKISVAQALCRPDVDLSAVAGDEVQFAEDREFGTGDLDTLRADFRYEGYERRQAAQAQRVAAQHHLKIPTEFDYNGIPGLSREVVDRLSSVQPETVGQASRVPGVTPAAVAIVAMRVAQFKDGQWSKI